MGTPWDAYKKRRSARWQFWDVGQWRTGNEWVLGPWVWPFSDVLVSCRKKSCVKLPIRNTLIWTTICTSKYLQSGHRLNVTQESLLPSLKFASIWSRTPTTRFARNSWGRSWLEKLARQPSPRSSRRLNTSNCGSISAKCLTNSIHLRNHVSSERPPRSSVVPPKTKIFSILDRARVAMEESYKTSSEPSYHEHHAWVPPLAACSRGFKLSSLLVTKSLTKHTTIHSRTTTHRTSIPTVMPYIAHRLTATKHHQLLNISIMPTTIIPVNRTRQVITQTYRTHFIRITRKLTRIRIITTTIIAAIKITDRTKASVLTVYCCGNKNLSWNKP